MISTIYKKKKVINTKYSTSIKTSITTPLRANFIIHAPSLGVREIYTDHTWGYMHVYMCLCMGVYEVVWARSQGLYVCMHACVRLICHCVPASILPPWPIRSLGCL